MKTYNKSQIMKDAHYWRQVLKLSMSDALKMAWSNAKKVIAIREEKVKEAQAYNELKERQRRNTKVADMSHLANSLNMHYNRGSGAYCGD